MLTNIKKYDRICEHAILQKRVHIVIAKKSCI